MITLDQVAKIILEKLESDQFYKMTFSSPLEKDPQYKKIVIEKKFQDNIVFFQGTLFFGNQVKHENYNENDSLNQRVREFIALGYKQMDVFMEEENIKILTNKKMCCKVITSKNIGKINKISGHNKEKNYILPEKTPVPWLIQLDIMKEDGTVYPTKMKKFRQINHFLEMVDDINDHIPYGGKIVDFGCGKSYLTFALYYYFNTLKEKNISIIGLDLKKDVVSYCQGLAEDFGFEQLQFYAEDVIDFTMKNQEQQQEIHMVVSLHACDIATDYALYCGIKNQAEVILSVPCCQHELFSQVENQLLQPILRHGILKERFSALLTDGLRAELLESAGYKTSVIEFIETEHTPKNIMIRGLKKKGKKTDTHVQQSFQHIIEAFGVTPMLYRLLEEK